MQYIWQYLGTFLKIPALSIPQLSFYIGDRSASIFHTRSRLNFSALNTFFGNIAVLHLSVIFPMHLLKTWDIISYTTQIFAALREKVFVSAAQLLGNG